MILQDLPHDTIFRFYEGPVKALYTPLTGTTLNEAPDALLENDKILMENMTNLNSKLQEVEDLSIVYAIALG